MSGPIPPLSYKNLYPEEMRDLSPKNRLEKNIEELQKEIEKKYGIYLMTDYGGEVKELLENFLSEPVSTEDRKLLTQSLLNIDQALELYPRELTRKMVFPRNFTLVKNENDETIAGHVPHGSYITEVQITSGLGEKIHHEIFHALKHHAYGIKSSEVSEKWAKIFKADYLGENWKKAEHKAGFVTQLYQVPGKGIVYDHSSQKNAEEDMAMIIEKLFSPKIEERLFFAVQISREPLLKAKVELLTGCAFDSESKRFTHVLSKEELKEKFGLTEHLFYAKWSQMDIKILMDANYWNKIFRLQ